MTAKHRTLRQKMLATTATAALLAVPGIAHAQLVSAGDLDIAIDGNGNSDTAASAPAGSGGVLQVTGGGPNVTNITVLKPVVIANWNSFNVSAGNTLNVSKDASVAAAKASLLNRVIGGTFSDMSGTVNATDVNFWLMNQNGILFGSSGVVNSNSAFLASTLDVTDANFFDFYNNGATGTVQFSGVSSSFIGASSGAQFVTNGSLMFVGAALDLTGVFDAQTGTVSFVAAQGVDVAFNAGSPVSYTLTAGTTIANQQVGGTVSGNSAQFVLLSAAAAMNALLTVNADVATSAVAGTSGIRLLAGGDAANTDLVVNGTLTSTGTLDVDANSDATFNQPVSAGAISIDVGGTLTAGDLTATVGLAELHANTIVASDVAGAGGIIFDAGNASSATFDSLTSSGGSIGVSGFVPGTLTVNGATSGTAVSLISINALNTGSVTSTAGTTSLLSLDGAVTSGAISATGGNATVQGRTNVTTTSISATGNVDVDSTNGGALNLGALNAGANILLDTTGSATFGAATAGGAFNIGTSLDPSSITATGNVSAGSINFDSTGALTALNITATAGDIDIDTASVNAGALSATDDVFVDTAGGIALASARADSDSSGAGNLAIGATTLPTTLSITGAAQGVSVDLQALGNLGLGSVTSTGGVIDLDSTNGAINAGAISATGGDAQLTARTSVTTTSIASTASIDVDSTNGGNLNLGTLNAGSNISLDTSASATFGAVTAGGAFAIGGTIDPNSIAATGNVSAGSVDFDSTGALNALNITATAGDIDIDTASVNAGALSATDDVFVDAAGNVMLASARADSDSSGAGGVFIGNTVAPTLLTISGTTQGASVDIIANGDTNLGAVTSTAGLIDIDVTGGLNAGAVSSTGGDTSLTATGGVNTTSISSSAAIDVDSLGGGNLSVGNLTAGSGITLDTSGTVTGGTVNAGGTLAVGASNLPGAATFTGNITAGSLDIQAGGNLNLAGVTSTAGVIDLDSTVGAINAGAVSANGGDALLTARAGVTTTSISSSAGIDVDSLNGGDLALGNLNAGTTITLDTAGTVGFGAATAGGAFTIGGAGDPSAITATGNVTAASVDFDATGALTALNIAATAGDIDIDVGSVSAGALSATDDVFVDAAGSISLASARADSDSSGAGNLVIGATTLPTSLAISGASQGVSVDLQAAGNLTLGNVTSTGGVIDLDSTTGAITAAGVSATGGDAQLTAPGAITTTSIVSTAAIDVDSTAGGNLSLGDLDAGTTIALDTAGTVGIGSAMAGGAFTIGASVDPSAVTATGNIAAGSVDFDTTGLLDLQDVSATGTVRFDADAIDAGNVSGDLGISFATLDNTGVTSFASLISTGGDVAVLGIIPGSITVTGETRGQNVSLVAIDFLDLGDVNSTVGDVLLDSGGYIVAEDVSAAVNAYLQANDDITTSSITAGGFIDVDSFSGGALDLGNLDAVGNINLDTTGSLEAGSIETDAALLIGTVAMPSSILFTGNAIANSMTINSVGAITTQDLTSDLALTVQTMNASLSTGAVTVNDPGAALTLRAGGATSDVTSDALSTNGGDILVSAGQNIVTGDTSTIPMGGASVGNIGLHAGGSITTGASNTGGDFVAQAGTTFTGGALVAGDDIEVSAAGDITVASASTTGLGADSSSVSFVGAPGASSLLFGAEAAELIGSNARLVTSGGSLQAGSFDVANDIILEATTGGVTTTGLSEAGGDMTVDAAGAIELAGTDIAGNLLVGQSILPASVTFTADASAGSVVVDTSGAFQAELVTSTIGNVDVNAGSIDAAGVSAAANAILQAGGSVTTGGIGAGGYIDVDSTGGGALDLGNLGAGTTIDLDTIGTVRFGMATGGGAFTIGGTNVPASVTATGNIEAATVDFDAVGLVSLRNVASTVGAVTINAGSIGAGVVSAATNVTLQAGGSVTTTAIGAGTFIDVDSTGGGLLNLGGLSAGTYITLDTTGSVAADTVVSGDSLTVGGVRAPSTVTFTGDAVIGTDATIRSVGAVSLRNVTADNVSVVTGSGSISALDITAVDASGGLIGLTARGAASDIAVAALSSTQDIIATAGRNITTGDIEFTGTGTIGTVALQAGGNIATGAVSMIEDVVAIAGGTVTTGLITAGDDVVITAGGAISVADVTVNGTGSDAETFVFNGAPGESTGDFVAELPGLVGSNIQISSTGAGVTGGNLSAANTITIDAPGAIALGSATADSDSNGAGNLAVGATTLPSSLTVTGVSKGVAIDLQASGAVTLAAVTSTGGVIDIDSTAGAIAATDVSATGGDALLTAFGGVTTNSITSTTGAIDVDSTNGGNLALGDLDAATAIALDTAGTVNLGTADAGGAFTIGGTIDPSAITATGNVTAASVDFESTGAVTAQTITSTAGNVDVNAGSISAAAVAAAANAILQAGGSVTTGGIGAGGFIDVDSTGGGALDLGGLNAGTTIALDTAGTVRFGTVTAGGAFTIGAAVDPSTITATGNVTAASVDFDASGALTAVDITATAGDIDIDTGSVSAGALSATDDVFVDAAGSVALASARADSDSSGAGTLAIGATTLPSSLSVTGASQGVAADLQASGNVALGTVVSTNGVVDIDSTAGSISTAAVTAAGGDALLTAAQNVTATGTVSSTGKVDIDATNGAISTVAVTATGNAELTAKTTVMATGTVRGRLVDIDAGGSVSLVDVTSTAGVIDIDSTGGSITAATVSATGGDALLTASQNVTTTGSVTSSGKVDIDATSGAISTAAVTANGGNAELTAGGAVTTTGLVKASGAIDVDSTGGGTLALGQALTGAGAALQAGTTIALDTAGAVTAGGTTAGGAITVGNTVRPSSITFTGPVSGASFTANTLGAFAAQGSLATTGALTIGNTAAPSGITLSGPVTAATLAATTTGSFTTGSTAAISSSATVTARDMVIGGAFGGSNATVTFRAGSTGGVALGSGTATFSLSDTELDRVTATTFTIDAGANAVTVTDVSFASGTGSQRLNVATTGTINFAGNVTGDGAGRIFRFGGSAASGDATATGLATRITGDIEAATLNFGQATLDLRAIDIAFGRKTFLTDVAGRNSGDLAILFVGNATSSLYNSQLTGPLGGQRATDKVYLRAGSLSVAYGNSALFQNTGSVGAGATTTDGVVIGSVGGSGTLTLDTLDTTNTFALFGQINSLVGPSAAVAGPSVIIVDSTAQPPFSRINGCQIGSGADCLNTTIGTTIIQLPREAVNPLSADGNVLVPFDPLVGTNNEGLFSDAASDDENLDCPRDERGVCIDRQGDN